LPLVVPVARRRTVAHARVKPVSAPAPEPPKAQPGDRRASLALSFASGAVNAGSMLACGRFVTHVTGTATLIGLDVGRWALVTDYLLVLFSFIAGAIAVGAAPGGRERGPAARLALTVVVLVLALVTTLGVVGVFDPFGSTVEEASDFALLSMLGFAMGILNASSSRWMDNARVTHLTGEATDLGLAIGRGIRARGERRHEALSAALLRASKFVAFISGAGAMAWIGPKVGYYAFIAPAALVLGVLARAFRPRKTTAAGSDAAETRDVIASPP